ncbi:MAG TPA: lectin-like protein [Verrucomicrobiae bacterium]|nr:lectin-like protein [Verrucomicrobiae bacterium]
MFGFRFKAPTRANHEDLLWAFVEPGDLKEWYILPEKGEMDGFTNFYHTSKGDYIREKPLLPLNGNQLILQHLNSDDLKDGQSYLIWLGFGKRNPPAMSLMFTFANFDPTNPHPLVEFEKAISIHELATGPIVNPDNHHTYMLLRPANWERSERIAEKLGGHLATIRNQAEEDWIFKTFGKYGGTRRLLWIGLNDLENRFHFSWASGESVSYTDWARGDPDNAGPRGQDYAAIFFPGHSQENKWKDWNTRARASAMNLPIDGVVEIIPTNNPETNLTAANNSVVPIRPDVTVTSDSSSILLQWPVSASDYVLVVTTNLSQPFTMFGYSEQTNREDGIIYVTITNPSPQMFFRLKKP